jgi:hypothetical protein
MKQQMPPFCFYVKRPLLEEKLRHFRGKIVDFVILYRTDDNSRN